MRERTLAGERANGAVTSRGPGEIQPREAVTVGELAGACVGDCRSRERDVLERRQMPENIEPAIGNGGPADVEPLQPRHSGELTQTFVGHAARTIEAQADDTID